MADPAMPSLDPIDRLAPGVRPDRPVLMYQKWRSLLFLHWAVDPEAIRPLVPEGLDLDLYEGRAYVGLVLFTMLGVRPRGMPAIPGLSTFHETNVRTYVRAGRQNPGVWFFSLDAANSVAVVLARALFSLPYHRARMSLKSGRDLDPQNPTKWEVSYTSSRLWPGPLPAYCNITARLDGDPPVTATPDTLDHFLIERYHLFRNRHGRLYSGQVHHKPYPIQNAEVLVMNESLLAASGLTRPDCSPLAHFSSGVDVEIFSLGNSAAL